ncbi:MAG: DUF2125 domain-containing protein [Rhodobacteraceae bacterium]|nr:DUF2125 domain-containing protein [Paracoccaceae bacterium]
MRLIFVAMIVCATWGAYWAVSHQAMRGALQSWFEARRDLGWQADFGALDSAGFPTRHVMRLTDVALADPSTGALWRSPGWALDARAIWPGHVTMNFADGTQKFAYFDNTATLDATGLIATLDLRPGLALELADLGLAAGKWRLAGPAGPLAQADDLHVSMQQQTNPETYRIALSARSFAPGIAARQAARIPPGLPRAFDALTLDMTASFDRPWDRAALETGRPQPRLIDLALADAHWGALRLRAAGSVTVDADGIPEGTITIRAENWRAMLEMAAASGALPDPVLRATERGLAFLARLGDDPDRLVAQLNLRQGVMALGPFPLGPAPRLILR